MSATDVINFTRGVPANESFPIDEVIESVTGVLREQGAAILQYGPASGFGPLRDWLGEFRSGTQDLSGAGIGCVRRNGRDD